MNQNEPNETGNNVGPCEGCGEIHDNPTSMGEKLYSRGLINLALMSQLMWQQGVRELADAIDVCWFRADLDGMPDDAPERFDLMYQAGMVQAAVHFCDVMNRISNAHAQFLDEGKVVNPAELKPLFEWEPPHAKVSKKADETKEDGQEG